MKGSFHLMRASLHLMKESFHLMKGSFHVVTACVHPMKWSFHFMKGSFHLMGRSFHLMTESFHLLERFLHASHSTTLVVLDHYMIPPGLYQMLIWYHHCNIKSLFHMIGTVLEPPCILHVWTDARGCIMTRTLNNLTNSPLFVVIDSLNILNHWIIENILFRSYTFENHTNEILWIGNPKLYYFVRILFNIIRSK